jgi:DNA-binding transcriptional MerR regulator
MLIGEFAQRGKLTRDTIRYYEKLGLVTSERAGGNGYRHYAASALQRLQHIHQLKQTGFTLQEIRALLQSNQVPPHCGSLPEQLAAKVKKLNSQITNLRAKRDAMLAALTACNADCTAVAGMPSCLSAQKPSVSSACC